MPGSLGIIKASNQHPASTSQDDLRGASRDRERSRSRSRCRFGCTSFEELKAAGAEGYLETTETTEIVSATGAETTESKETTDSMEIVAQMSPLQWKWPAHRSPAAPSTAPSTAPQRPKPPPLHRQLHPTTIISIASPQWWKPTAIASPPPPYQLRSAVRAAREQ